MKKLPLMLIVVLCMSLMCTFALASETPATETETTIEVIMPAEDGEVVLQPALESALDLNGNVTFCLEQNAEGAWYICGVTFNETTDEAVEAEEITAEIDIPVFELVTVAAVVDGEETIVTPAMVLTPHEEEDHACVDVTVNAEDVAAAMGEKYSVGDLNATTITFTTTDSRTTAKLSFEIVAPVWIRYTDGVDGEEIFSDVTRSAKVGSRTPAFRGDTPTREGYLFNGWGSVSTYVTDDATYKAQWLKLYTVTYTNGTSLVEYVVAEGQPTPSFEGIAPEREGYRFNGWGKVASTVTGDVTYEPQWIKLCTVTYTNGIDGTVLAEYVVDEGQPTPAFDGAAPKREGYEFNGWGEVASTVTADVTYSAQWLEYFTVTYLSGYDQTILEEHTVLEGQPTPAFAGATPEREGYGFNGWGEVASTVTGDASYSAQWLEYFTVTYLSGYDQTTLEEHTVLEGQPTPAFAGATPEREGYGFNGWGEVPSTVTGDATYSAQWLQYFTVTYFDWFDQVTLEEYTVLEGQPTPTINPNNYTKPSYVNMGFDTAIAPTVTGDVTYTMIQMVPPRENNVSGLKIVCECICQSERHTKTNNYVGSWANAIRLDDLSENVYFDGTNYRCQVYLTSDFSALTQRYCSAVSSAKPNNHTCLGAHDSSFTVTYNMSQKKWYADQSTLTYLFECPTSPVANANVYSNTGIRVKGIVDGTVETLAGMKLSSENVSVGPITGNSVIGWTVQVSVTNFEPYIQQFEAKYGVQCEVDSETTGTLVYTYTYTMPSDYLIAADGSGWTFLYPSTDVKSNGYTIWVNVTE